MFANRYTALIDACALAPPLKRNLLLSLAEAEFYRIRWSERILDETELAIEKMLKRKRISDAQSRAQRARNAMSRAFEEASVSEYEVFLPACAGLPDPKDTHVVAAALQTRAAVIVTDNLKHFPEPILSALGLEVRSTDTFLANTISLDHGLAVAAVRKMRERFKRPEKTAEHLLLDMEANGLIETVDTLRPYCASL